MSNFLYSTLGTAWYVLKERKYRWVAIATSIAFALFYIFFTGIVTISSVPMPIERSLPYFRVITQGPIGQVPWIIAYLDRYTVFSMSPEAMISTIAISSLVGINSALLVYRFRAMKAFNCSCPSGSPAFFASIVPASLSVFACCGGGLLLAIFGAGLFTAVMPYGNLFSIISILGLTTAMFVSAYGINLNLRSIGKNLTGSI